MPRPPRSVTEPIFAKTMPCDGYVPVQDVHRSDRRGVRREIAELAYEEYRRQYGSDQSFDRLHERGGFGVGEIITLLTETIWRGEAV